MLTYSFEDGVTSQIRLDETDLVFDSVSLDTYNQIPGVGHVQTADGDYYLSTVTPSISTNLVI